MLRTGMLKGFMAGAIGSRTAALLAPYTGIPAIADCRVTNKVSSMP